MPKTDVIMTSEYIQELRELYEAASDGPWIGANKPTVVEDRHGWLLVDLNYAGMKLESPEWDAACVNTAFILAASKALPEALDEIERLRKAMDTAIKLLADGWTVKVQDGLIEARKEIDDG